MLLIILIKLLIVNAKITLEYKKGWQLFEYDIDGVKYTNDSDYELAGARLFTDERVLQEHEKFLIRQSLIPYGYIKSSKRDILSIPRTRPGIPYTLNYFINSDDGPYSPMLMPFPDSKEGKKYTSVYGMFEDACSRLWFVDTGYLDIPGVKKQVQPPALILYNLDEEKQLFRKDIDMAMLHKGTTSGLRTILVDFIIPCSEAYVYITDDTTTDLIVFSLEDMRFMIIYRGYNEADSRRFNITKKLNLLQIQYHTEFVTLVQKYRHKPNDTYEQYLEYLNSTRVLFNPKIPGKRKIYTNENYPNYFGYVRTRNFDGNVEIFANYHRNHLFCWNSDTPFDVPYISALTGLNYNEYLFTGLDVSGGTLHGIIQRSLNSTTQKFNRNVNNFWYFRIEVDKLLEGTSCAQTNKCTDFVNKRAKSQEPLMFKRMRPKYVADSYVKDFEKLWNVTGIMN